MNHPVVLAYYLPQFHEIEENNTWWGKGFTEWVALNSSETYYKKQKTRKPMEPFFEYELPCKEVMEWQSNLAKANCIDGFFVWDYWFGAGEKLLSKPKEYILNNDVSFSYAFIWANHSWYNKAIGKLLIEQKYLGKEDYIDYFNDCLPHFKSDNYIKINNRPIFGIFKPTDIPDLDIFISVFKTLAQKNGFDGIHFVAENTNCDDIHKEKFDSHVNSTKYFSSRKLFHPVNFIREQLIKRFGFNTIGPVVYNYTNLVSKYNRFSHDESPAIFTGWDTTPRHGRRGTILMDFTVESFTDHLKKVFHHAIKNNSELIIIKSWNEWAEGNLMEPDTVFGDSILTSFRTNYIYYFGDKCKKFRGC